MDVIILCGGLGKRLRKVINDRPKPMAAINKRPFLDILIAYLRNFGFRYFILSIGYKAENIKEYYNKKKTLNIRFSEEKTPLGTGGAFKMAQAFIRSNSFLVMNGDSFCNVNLNKFLKFHIQKNALASIVLVKDRQNKDCGRVKVLSSNQIAFFKEKTESTNDSLVNVGIYMFKKDIFSLMPKDKKFSLEYDFFPKITKERFLGYLTNSILLDIGTPEGLKRANLYFKHFKR